MKQFTDEMLKEMLKMVDDPNYEPQMDEPTDEEINVMMPALFKEVLAARKVIQIAKHAMYDNEWYRVSREAMEAYDAVVGGDVNE